MLSGKAVARAVRGHFLIESALTIVLLKAIMSSDDNKNDVEDLSKLYDSVVLNGCDVDNAEFHTSLNTIEHRLSDVKADLSGRSRTAKLWLQYMYYVSLLKLLIRAERMSDWHLHIFSISQMINLFAATGHNNYTRCARLYVEMMLDLPTNNPWLYEQLVNGGHVARRSNKFWAGLSTDLTIEQSMMKALKGRGGLTRGRGVTESVRTTWVSTVHKSAAIHSALAELTDLQYIHEDMQHPELGKTRAKRDFNDLNKILEFLEMNNPFETSNSRLRSLVSGIAASDSTSTATQLKTSVVKLYRKWTV
jgi:hypothetical protein